MPINRIKTGVDGLDELVEGGFPEGSTILISGSAGTGKTILSLQFLIAGAKNNEPGIYLTVEESRDKIINQAEQFGWDLEKLEKERVLVINVMKDVDIVDILKKLEKEAKEINAKRLVVDSLSMLNMFSRVYSTAEKELSEIGAFSTMGRELGRLEIFHIVQRINALGLTTLIISELPEESRYLSRDTISEFVCDGVIKLVAMEGIGKRTVTIKKLRATKHEIIPIAMKITERGIVIEPD